MKTIINKLRYTLLLSFFALAALGNMNAAEILLTSWDYPGTFPSTWTVPNTGGGSVGGYYFGGSSGANIIIPSSDLQGNSTVTVKLTAAKENNNNHSVTVNGTASSPALTTSLVELTWENVNASSGVTIHVSDYYVNISAIKVYAVSNDPQIVATPTTLNVEASPGSTSSQTVSVTGYNLTGNITATLNDANGVFSVSPASLGTSGGTLTVTYSPTAVGIHNATLTLSSAGADPVTITLNGTCEYAKTIFEDGSDTNEYLPIYGYYYDNFQVNQMIYPAGELTELVGTKLKSMTFYSSNILFHEGTFNASLGITSQTAFSSINRITGLTNVRTGQVAHTGTELVIIFDEPFEYNGGNLVIEIEVTSKGTYGGHSFFYGVNQTTNTGFNTHGSNAISSGVYTGQNSGLRQFLPKVKFTYELSEPVTQGTVSPSAVNFGEVQVGQSATQTVTITNTGNQPFTPVIDATSLPAGVTVSTASQIEAGGNLPLTVTFAPTADGAVSGTFTVTIPVPDEQGDDIVVTVNVTGSGYEISSTLTSQTVVVPVYKSDIQAPSRTYVFSREEVENDTLRTLSYSDGAKIQTQVLVKNEEPVVSYDLHRKAGSGNWTYPGGNAVAQAVQQSSPSTYVVGQETFTIPQDATQLWVPMTDEGVDASSELLYVPVTVADGVVTTGNTYGAPQVAATSDGLTIHFEVTGSKSAGGVGGNWDQTLPDGTTENYCVYSPVITIKSVDPAFGINTRLPYMFRAWLLVDDSDIYYYDIKRVPNTNDPTHGHIVADSLITQPKLLGTIPGTPDMVGHGQFGPIGYEWTEDGPISPSGNVKPENVFGAPTDLGNREMKFAVRIYYYKPQAENPSGHMLRAAGDDTPEDGYAYADQDESDSQDIQTAVSSIYGDREVVDVQYVNALGQQSSKPFEGVNIVVTRYSDGTMSTTKVLK